MHFFSAFLVADTQLYKRLCPSVRPSVGPLEAVIELKSGEIGVLDTFCICLSIGMGMGMDRGWMPLPTRPKRYCGPASLVIPM